MCRLKGWIARNRYRVNFEYLHFYFTMLFESRGAAEC